MNKFVDNNNYELKENVIAGIVGAFLFSLAGAAVYFLLYLIGYVASISGVVGAVCAVKGYSLFAKKESKKGIIISAVISLLVMVIAWYLCLSYEIYDIYKFAFETGEIDFYLTFIESIRAIPVILEDAEIAATAYKDLALGLFFCLIGCASYIITKFKSSSKKNTELVEEQVGEEQLSEAQTDEEHTTKNTEE